MYCTLSDVGAGSVITGTTASTTFTCTAVFGVSTNAVTKDDFNIVATPSTAKFNVQAMIQSPDKTSCGTTIVVTDNTLSTIAFGVHMVAGGNKGNLKPTNLATNYATVTYKTGGTAADVAAAGVETNGSEAVVATTSIAPLEQGSVIAIAGTAGVVAVGAVITGIWLARRRKRAPGKHKTVNGVELNICISTTAASPRVQPANMCV